MRLFVFSAVGLAIYGVLGWFYMIGPNTFVFADNAMAGLIRDTFAGLVGALYGVVFALEFDHAKNKRNERDGKIKLVENIHQTLDATIVTLNHLEDRLCNFNDDFALFPLFECDTSSLTSLAIQRMELLHLTEIGERIDSAHFWMERVNRALPPLVARYIDIPESTTWSEAEFKEVCEEFGKVPQLKRMIESFASTVENTPNGHEVRSDMLRLLKAIGTTIVTIHQAKKSVSSAIVEIEDGLQKEGRPKLPKHDGPSN